MKKINQALTVRGAYTTPEVKALPFCSEELFVNGSTAGGHTPANPDPNGDIEGARRKMFEYDFMHDDSSEE